eukprot:6345259-Amphidinium_carterae.1
MGPIWGKFLLMLLGAFGHGRLTESAARLLWKVVEEWRAVQNAAQTRFPIVVPRPLMRCSRALKQRHSPGRLSAVAKRGREIWGPT